MKYPQIVVFEPDGVLAQSLEPMIAERGQSPRRWLLHEARQAPACLDLLGRGGPALLVLKLGRNLVREFTLLDEVHRTLPDVPILAVGDVEDPALMSLALELGAAHVIQPPQPRRSFIDTAESLMKAAIRRVIDPESEMPARVSDF